MLTDYIEAAMEAARYELLEEGEGYFGSIEGFQGLWASATSLEKCRRELRSGLEDWIMVGLSLGHPMPVISGLTLVVKKSA